MTTIRVVVAFMVGVALTLALIVGYEAVYVGLIASAEEVAKYRFGSEAMMGEGGRTYESREVYVGMSALCAALFVVASVTGVRFIRKGGLMWFVLSCLCLIVGFLFVYGV
jgi:hypothetical protein